MHLDGLYVVDDDVVETRARDPHPQRARWRGFCFSGTRASMRSSVPLSMWSVAPVFGVRCAGGWGRFFGLWASRQKRVRLYGRLAPVLLS